MDAIFWPAANKYRMDAKLEMWCNFHCFWDSIGDRFIKITPGGSDLYLENGEEFLETEPSISLEELISKYMFSNE